MTPYASKTRQRVIRGAAAAVAAAAVVVGAATAVSAADEETPGGSIGTTVTQDDGDTTSPDPSGNAPETDRETHEGSETGGDAPEALPPNWTNEITGPTGPDEVAAPEGQTATQEQIDAMRSQPALG